MYGIVRTEKAGVFAGIVESFEGTQCVLTGVRWIWYWEGAASLHQLAVTGTTKPEKCKFPMEVAKVYLTGVIQVIPCTPEAEANIKAVPEWVIE